MKKSSLKLLLITVFAIILEILWGNKKFWLTLKNHPENPPVYLSDNTLLKYDQEYLITNDFSLKIDDIANKVQSISIDIEYIATEQAKQAGGELFRTENAVIVWIYASDEGNANEYVVTKETITPYAPSGESFFIETFGKAKTLKFRFPYASGRNIRINKIELNPNIPLRFNFLRFILLFLILYTIITVFFEDYFIGKDPFRFIKLGVSLVLICVFLLSLLRLHAGENPVTGLNYQDLAHALSEKRLWVAENQDEKLASMENPYDTYQRATIGATVYGDTAYYEGMYYIYFGITPVLLFFLPYYLFSGQNLSYFKAECIIIVLTAIGCYLLIELFRKKLFPKLPTKVQILYSILLSTAGGNIIILKRSQIYYTAIGTALMLTIWGLCFWFYASERYNIWFGMIGSVCLALAVGARPQFAMASFLFFPIFIDWISERSKNITKIILILIPYVPIGVFLMWYNAARFGSPFDFGANYNLTNFDMVHNGFHPLKLIYGLWYYFFNLIKISPDFPYLVATIPSLSYPGYFFVREQIGGVFALIPALWVLFIGFSKNNRNLFSKIFVGICITASIIIVCVDTLIAGICVRYQADFRYLLVIASAAFTFTILEQSGTERNCHIYRSFSGLAFLSIFLSFLTIFSQYENPDYLTINEQPLSYFLIVKEIFGIVGF